MVYVSRLCLVLVMEVRSTEVKKTYSFMLHGSGVEEIHCERW